MRKPKDTAIDGTTARQVKELGKRLEAVARIPREEDAARLAIRSPATIMARPALLAELRDMVEGAEEEMAVRAKESRQERAWARWSETGSAR
jgi:hypothetical protein